MTLTGQGTDDRPEVMREYGKLQGLDAANWRFPTRADGQPEDATRRLAEAFGRTFTKDDEGIRMHGIVTHVIDRRGNWRANFHGQEFQATSPANYVNALANDRHPVPKLAGPGFWS